MTTIRRQTTFVALPNRGRHHLRRFRDRDWGDGDSGETLAGVAKPSGCRVEQEQSRRQPALAATPASAFFRSKLTRSSEFLTTTELSSPVSRRRSSVSANFLSPRRYF